MRYSKGVVAFSFLRVAIFLSTVGTRVFKLSKVCVDRLGLFVTHEDVPFKDPTAFRNDDLWTFRNVVKVRVQGVEHHVT